MSRSIIYIGDDFRYWQNIQGYITGKLNYLKFEFSSHYNPEDTPISLFNKIKSKIPDIIYVDYTTNTIKHLDLIKLLRNDNSTRFIIVVGLLGVDDREVSLKRAINSGILFNFFKQAELDSIVCSPLIALYPEEVVEPNYARADLEFKIKGFSFAKINKITGKALEFETPISLEDKDNISLKLLLPEKSLPHSGAVITLEKDNVSNNDCTKQFVAEWEFTPPLLDIKEESPIERDKREQDYEDRVKFGRQALESWLKVQLSYYATSKEIRVLIIDKELTYLEKANLTDHNFLFKVQTRLLDADREIAKFKPHFIFLAFDNNASITEEEAKELEQKNKIRKKNKMPIINTTFNNVSMLRDIITTIKWNKLKTEIYVFDYMSDQPQGLKDICNFEGITSIASSFAPQVVDKVVEARFEKLKKKRVTNIDQMIKNLKSKDPVKYLKISRKTFQEDILFMSEGDNLYHGNLLFDVYLTGLSEAAVSIATKRPLEIYSVIRLDIPTVMYITIIPNKMRAKSLKDVGNDYKYSYQGLIHSIDENQRMLLRRCVNAANAKATESNERLKKTMNIKETSPESEENKS